MLRQIQHTGFNVTVHVLDAPKSIRQKRVQQRNIEQGETFSMIVPDHIFEIASDMWEAPNEIEIEEFNFIFPLIA
ncbi:hypothetical protein B9T31_16305 [Acinetobacter sp. ANC 4558]|uniref:hypothetical protein n=1 Tax=Acinetobacter sp. ANC 4558 TaxID=1977876 RepID=UPI000A3553C0|nr:hypothetical protein [Acinetobacter sp. ANC 4558]OTG80073.1 hypothetical protein B9T31_16305 [Acinetobacter sp. ANC 4558]